jgi:hypothetical protein
MDLQVLKAVALILGVQILMWTLGASFFAIYFNFISLDAMAMDPIGLWKIALICGIISSVLSALEVPILYFTRFNFYYFLKYYFFTQLYSYFYIKVLCIVLH